MSILRRTWNTSQFYMTPSDTLAAQFQKVIDGIAPVRKFEEGSYVWADTPGQNRLSDILLGLAYGDNTDRLKVRFYNDYTNNRVTIQKNTGTDASPTWIDLLYISTVSPYLVTAAGGLTLNGDTTINGTLTMGDDIDMNGFYIRNFGGFSSFVYSMAGRTYSTTFTNQTSVVVLHNLSTLTPIVTVFQTSDNAVIVPENIVVDNLNQVTVTFGEASVSGKIFVAGGVGEAGISFSDGTETINYSRILNVNQADFYLTKSNDGNGYAVLNAQPGQIQIQDTLAFNVRSPAIRFNRDTFYIERASDGTPIVNGISTSGSSGVTDHGALTGLTDDDHSQYLLATQATDRSTFTTNWADLTDGGVTSLHSHAGSGSTDPGFYGIVWSDGTVTKRTDRLSFSNADFYLDGRKPTLNLKDALRDNGNQKLTGTLELNIPAGEPDSLTKIVNGVSRSHRLFIHQDGDYGIGSDFHGAANTTVPGNRGYRSRGTAAAPTIVADGDILNGIYGYGFDGVDYESAGRVRILVDGTPASDSMPGKVQIQVTPPGSVTPETAVQVRSDKHVEMENTLRVKNAVTAEAFYLTSGGEVGTGSALTVQDVDGAPTATNVTTIKFTNGSVTDDGAGVVTVTTGGGSGISTLTIGGQSFGSQTTLGFNSSDFYLSGGATSKVLNLRQEQDIYKGHLPGVIVDNFLLEPDSDHSFTVLDATLDCRTGTASVGFYIIRETNLDFPGRPITGLHAVTASSTKATTAATAQNTMNVGDRLLMSIFGVASAEHLVYKVRLKKT